MATKPTVYVDHIDGFRVTLKLKDGETIPFDINIDHPAEENVNLSTKQYLVVEKLVFMIKRGDFRG